MPSSITVPQYFAGQPAVMLTFDDKYLTIYDTAFPIMQQYRARGTFYAITGQIETGADTLTWANLAEMQAAGWSIGSHTRDHTQLTTVSQADAQTAIENGRDDLVAHSMTAANHMSYPYGLYNATVKAAATAAGVLTARTIDSNQIIELGAGTDLLQLPMAKGWGVADTLEYMLSFVQNALTQKRIVIYNAHSIGAGADISVEELTGLLQYCTDRFIPLITIEDLYASMSGAVTVPVGA